jgi:sortase A
MIHLPAKKIVNVFSLLIIFLGIGILLLTFGSPLFYEVQYQAKTIAKPGAQEQKNKEIVPVNADFSIVIPKINANAPIFPNVNPFEEKEFSQVLKKGVAHAKGTSFPGNNKNIYLFAHSTDAFFNVGRYNAVF